MVQLQCRVSVFAWLSVAFCCPGCPARVCVCRRRVANVFGYIKALFWRVCLFLGCCWTTFFQPVVEYSKAMCAAHMHGSMCPDLECSTCATCSMYASIGLWISLGGAPLDSWTETADGTGGSGAAGGGLCGRAGSVGRIDDVVPDILGCSVCGYPGRLSGRLVWNHFQHSSLVLSVPTRAGRRRIRRLRAGTRSCGTAGVRLPRPGRSESSFRTDPFTCPMMIRHRYRIGNGVTGGSESMRDG